MTKIQKKISKRLNSKDTQVAFVRLIRMQQTCLGGYEDWEKVHRDRYKIQVMELIKKFRKTPTELSFLSF